MDKMVGFSGQVYRFTSPSALATFIKALKIQNA